MKRLAGILLPVLLIVSNHAIFAQIQITLRQGFIDSIKNTVTISTDYIIDKAHKRPNPPSKDGDMHIAGRSESIGLPIVAEIMNAAGQASAVRLVHSVEGANQAVSLTGVWRLWCEHAGEDLQIQGNPIDQITTTNPPHVFEIHPITKLQDHNLLPSLKPIDGFNYKKADDALFRYASTRCEIIPNNDNTVTIQTNGIGYNYVECNIEVADNSVEVSDGRFVFCKILTVDNDIVAQKVRVGFVKNSIPENSVKAMGIGDRMHVIAIPRIDLALVSFRVNHASDPQFPNILSWNLPFELVAVAVVE